MYHAITGDSILSCHFTVTFVLQITSCNQAVTLQFLETTRNWQQSLHATVSTRNVGRIYCIRFYRFTHYSWACHVSSFNYIIIITATVYIIPMTWQKQPCLVSFWLIPIFIARFLYIFQQDILQVVHRTVWTWNLNEKLTGVWDVVAQEDAWNKLRWEMIIPQKWREKNSVGGFRNVLAWHRLRHTRLLILEMEGLARGKNLRERQRLEHL